MDSDRWRVRATPIDAAAWKNVMFESNDRLNDDTSCCFVVVVLLLMRCRLLLTSVFVISNSFVWPFVRSFVRSSGIQQLPNMSELADDEVPVCRVCRVGEEAGHRLYYPCRCRGSIRCAARLVWRSVACSSPRRLRRRRSLRGAQFHSRKLLSGVAEAHEQDALRTVQHRFQVCAR